MFKASVYDDNENNDPRMMRTPLLEESAAAAAAATIKTSEKKRKYRSSKVQIVLWAMIFGYIAHSGSLLSALYFEPDSITTTTSTHSGVPLLSTVVEGSITKDELLRLLVTVPTTEAAAADSHAVAQAQSTPSNSNKEDQAWITITATTTTVTIPQETMLGSFVGNFSAIVARILWMWLIMLLFVKDYIIDDFYSCYFEPLDPSTSYNRRDILVFSTFWVLLGYSTGSFLAWVVYNLFGASMVSSEVDTATLFAYAFMTAHAIVNVILCRLGVRLYISSIVKPRLEEDKKYSQENVETV